MQLRNPHRARLPQHLKADVGDHKMNLIQKKATVWTIVMGLGLIPWAIAFITCAVLFDLELVGKAFSSLAMPAVIATGGLVLMGINHTRPIHRQLSKAQWSNNFLLLPCFASTLGGAAFALGTPAGRYNIDGYVICPYLGICAIMGLFTGVLALIVWRRAKERMELTLDRE